MGWQLAGFWKENEWAHETLEELNDALVEWVFHSCLEGGRAFRVNYAPATVAFLRTDVGRLRDAALPRAKLATKGWRRMCPFMSRLPLPFQIICALCMILCKDNFFEMALAILLCTCAYLRPSELMSLRAAILFTLCHKLGRSIGSGR